MNQEPRRPAGAPEVPMLDAAEATRMLDSIFEESGVEPNSIPMEALTAYSGSRRDRRILRRVLLLIAAVLALLIPLQWFAPDFEVSLDPQGEHALPVYTVDASAFLPVSQVTARVGDRALPVYPEEEGVFRIEPTQNGEMTITVTYANRQQTEQQLSVRDVDEKCPEVVSAVVEKGKFRIRVRDDGAGVDYEGIYATDDSGTLRPESWDEAAGEFILRSPEGDCDLYVPDLVGNTLHLRQTGAAGASEAGNVSAPETKNGGERLTLAVIGEERSLMLEEGAVPLANGPGREKLCATHTLLALVFLLMTIGYVIYFDRYQKRLYPLREQAAVLEQRLREEDRRVL